MGRSTEHTNKNVIFALTMALALVAFALAGCGGGSQAKTPAAQEGQMGGGQMGGDEMSEMTCPMCNKGAPPVEKGSATIEDGVQVVRITMKDGYYSPNEITIKAGMPAKLIFTGDAKDCSGKPQIADLKAAGDLRETGETTIDLGATEAGTHPITCGMGSPGGNLIVE